MDTELLVDDRIDSGRDLINQLVLDGFDVDVAFWVRTTEESLWFFYIASNCVDADRLGDAYRAVYSSLSRLPDPWISLSQIKLVQPTNPIARDARAIRDRYAARIPTRYQGKRLGNLSIEEAYIYPKAGNGMTRHEVLQTVTALMERTGSLQPSIVALRDGTSLTAVPIAVQVQQPNDLQVVFQDVHTGRNRTVSADDVVSIQ